MADNTAIDRQSSLAGRVLLRTGSRNQGEYLRYEGDWAPATSPMRRPRSAALAFAAHLRAAGIAKGDAFVFWGENRPEWVVALWGCLLEGVVAVPVDFRSSAAVVAQIAGIVEAKALLIGEGLQPPRGLALSCVADAKRSGRTSSRMPTGAHEPAPADGPRGDPLHFRRDRRAARASPSRIATSWRT